MGSAKFIGMDVHKDSGVYRILWGLQACFCRILEQNKHPWDILPGS
jgi:hypothetical protein